jgi:hypothetical protein
MIQENYVNNTLTVKDELTRLDNLAYSADSLSDADVFDTIFDFDLSIYVALNTIKATSKCTKRGFGMVKFPQFLGRTSMMNKNKRDKIDIDTLHFLGEKPKITKEKVVKEKVKKQPKAKSKK